MHKVIELETAAEYFNFQCETLTKLVQELPDTLGTHAVFSDSKNKTLILQEIISWRLHSDGVILGMLIDPEKSKTRPSCPAMTVFSRRKRRIISGIFSASYCQQNQIRRS